MNDLKGIKTSEETIIFSTSIGRGRSQEKAVFIYCTEVKITKFDVKFLKSIYDVILSQFAEYADEI